MPFIGILFVLAYVTHSMQGSVARTVRIMLQIVRVYTHLG
jgi:hypothetical protein